ncbi:hypothetical protein BX285_6752 [Streptomyces sp. 1114.5]|nr:hypothetical protein BX285_6752 [Streptomyces sp. 1114.5]
MPCWTSFKPSNPHGAPLDQYDNNCANHGDWVCPRWYDGSGGYQDWVGASRVWAPAYYTVTWHYNSTYTYGWYTTIFC